MSTLTSMPIPAHEPAHEHAQYKRKRSPSHSRSRSPRRAASPPTNRRRSASPPPKVRIDLPKIDDVDPVRRQERERQLALRLTAQELDGGTSASADARPAFDARAEFAKLAGSKSGGVYMPPARLRALQAAASQDKASPEYQRLSWDALRKSITGIVNRVNVGNIKHVVPELFAENLIRGRGLFARSVMKAQAASLPYTPVFAALVSIINTKLPQVGELVLHRLVSQFRKSFKRNDKILCHSTTTFIAHLVNQSLAHEIIALQILVLLLERPTDDSVEIAVGFMREVGAFLAENSPKANASVYERFRVVLNEGTISQRVQFMVEVLMQVRKDKYKDNPILPEGLDLVPEEDQITHQVALEDDLQVQEGLNIFKFDPSYTKNEEKYGEIKAEILGENESSEGSGSDDDDDNSEDEAPVADKEGIQDETGTNLVNLRRTIYLTIMNSLNFEEAVHKLMKVNVEEGQEIEMCNMIIECCSQERSYSNFYGLIGERFSKLSRPYTASFEEAFRNYYDTVHRYETNRLRNIARFFGHLLATDSVSWAVLDVVKMNEEDTTSSSRIFVKILCGEMMEEMGLKGLTERFKDPEIRDCCRGLFPLDIPKNTRFAINYFTSIGLGAVTEEMREHLKNAPRIIMEQRRALLAEESSSSSDSSDSDLSSSSDSDSDSDSDSTPSRSPSPRRSAPRRRRSSTPPRTRGRDTSRESYRRRPDRSPPRSPSPSPPRFSRRDRSVSPRDRTRDMNHPPPMRRDPPPHRGRQESESPPPRRREDEGRYPPRDGPPRGGESYSRRGGDSRDRYRDRSPPRRGGYDATPPRRGGRDDSPPPPRRGGRDETPPRRGGHDETPPRRGGRDETPPRKGGRDMTPPRRSRNETPPRRGGRDETPPRRGSRDESPPRRNVRDEGRYGRQRSLSRERYDRRR
ncbi:MIF4G-domain-containing protein [Ramaria rubella]|nr:MIF4G-domain-containing protein [Ramaria rubella]